MITSLILASQLTVFCGDQRDYAEKVMTELNTGTPLATVLQRESESPLNQVITMMAFRRHGTAPVDFGNTVYLMCMENTDERPD